MYNIKKIYINILYSYIYILPCWGPHLARIQQSPQPRENRTQPLFKAVDGSKSCTDGWFIPLASDKSMGDLQDPTDWRYVNVPYFGPYELWGYSLRPKE